MKKSSKKLIYFLLLLIISVFSYEAYDYYYQDTLKIANWNLEVFGTAKASDSNLMNIYESKIENYDIIFVQEIRDASNTAFPQLCAKLENYSCLESSRAGRSSSKEQYGIIYRKGINLTSFTDYNPDSLNRWERPPIKVDFNINGYEFSVYNIHTKPDDVKNELMNLEKIVENKGNVFVVGDLNADCSYYNPVNEKEFDDWKWLVPDSEDTTTSGSFCAYDRIIANNDANKEFISYGVDKTGINEDVSDHYLVWAEIELKE